MKTPDICGASGVPTASRVIGSVTEKITMPSRPSQRPLVIWAWVHMKSIQIAVPPARPPCVVEPAQPQAAAGRAGEPVAQQRAGQCIGQVADKGIDQHHGQHDGQAHGGLLRGRRSSR
jgi:hypothetical protein